MRFNNFCNLFLGINLKIGVNHDCNNFLNIGTGSNIDFYFFKDHIHFLSLILRDDVKNVLFLCLNIGFNHDYSHFLGSIVLDLSKLVLR